MNQRLAVLAIMAVATVVGCGGRIYPVTSGSHAPGETFGYGHEVNGRLVPLKTETVIIWTRDISVEHHLAGELLRNGYIVVERARLQRILDEQNLRISLAGSSEQLTEEILRAGKLAGATLVIFVEVQREPSVGHEVKSASSAIRGVSVETGQVRWSGTARVKAEGLYILQDANEGDLAVLAMRRAMCLTEAGWIWKDRSEDTAGGCAKQAER